MKEYIIELNIPKEVTNDNRNEFSDLLKLFIDSRRKYGVCYFEVFDNMVERRDTLINASRIMTVDLRNCINGSRIVDYDFTPEIQSFFVKISAPDDFDFYSKGKFIPRLLINNNNHKFRICALDYVKKTR